jgi:hypothetical protein
MSGIVAVSEEIDRLEKIIASHKEAISQTRKNNPYYPSVYPEPTEEEWAEVRKMFQEKGLSQGKFFGAWGRRVWNNCLDELNRYLSADFE